MSSPRARLKLVETHLQQSASSRPETTAPHKRSANYHTLSPTFFLPRAALIEPEAEAVYHVNADGAVLRRTYAEVAERAKGLAYYLQVNGLRRVGILCPNSPAFLEAIFGIAAAGGVVVAVNYRLSPDDVSYILQHAEVEAVIVDQEFVPILKNYRVEKPDVELIVDNDTSKSDGRTDGQLDKVILDGLDYDRSQGSKGWSALECQAKSEDDVIALAYTSGTTARPKGVEYTHRGCYLAALGNAIESGLNLSDGRCRYLWTLPMFHAMGWTFPYAVTAVRGTHYCLRNIDYPHIWHLLKTERISHFNAAPTVNTLLCNAREAVCLPSPVRVTVAASPPTPHLFRAMTDLNLQPIHVYGLTETYGPITKGYQLPAWNKLAEQDRFKRLARQGHGFLTSLPARVVRTSMSKIAATSTTANCHSGSSLGGEAIVDVAQNGKEIGEVVLVGNICAKGYFKDEEATKQLFAGGVLHTGDLAVWHPDGAVQVLDRAKDIIISGGENISSVALESMLVRHPLILEAGVVGVSDERWGERPKAYITIKDEAKGEDDERGSVDFKKQERIERRRAKKAELCGQDVIKWAKQEVGEGGGGISGFMIPREVEVVAELPKTATGKVKKTVLREWAMRKH